MGRMKHFAIKLDVSKKLAELRGITDKEAKSIVEDVIVTMTSLLADPQYEGLTFLDVFTLEKVERKGRTGVGAMNGIEYSTPSSIKLRAVTGKKLFNLLNPPTKKKPKRIAKKKS